MACKHVGLHNTLWLFLPPSVQVMNNFLPSAVKFHYQFNLREMSNVVGGLCRMNKEAFKQPVQVRTLQKQVAAVGLAR
jgi:hypothetical protein